MNISVIVPLFVGTRGKNSSDEKPWVSDTNQILARKNHVKVFFLVADKKSFSVRNTSRNISKFYYEKLYFFEDPISIMMWKSLLLDTSDLAIIHGLPHITTLVALGIYSFKKTPIILFEHGIYSTEGLFCRLRNFFIKLFLVRQVDFVVALTKFDKSLLLRDWRADERKMAVIPLGLSTDDLHAIEKWKRNLLKKPDCFTFVFVGRLIKEKRADMLIDSFNMLLAARKKPVNVQLLLIGDGPEYKNLQLKVKDYGIGDYVKLLGWTDRNEIWKFYLLSNVVVLPSELEGFPYVIHEAFACGKPVIAANISGISEVVKHGANGLLFNSQQELTSCLAKMLNSPELLESLSREALSTAAKFSISFAVQNISDATGFDLV